MFSTIKRRIHAKFGWIWSSELSKSKKISFKTVENWNFAGPQIAPKQAETKDILNCSESLTSWEFKIFWVFKIGQLLLLKQLTSNLSEIHKSLTSWEFKIFWILKIGHLLLLKQLTSNLCISDKFKNDSKPLFDNKTVLWSLGISPLFLKFKKCWTHWMSKIQNDSKRLQCKSSGRQSVGRQK